MSTPWRIVAEPSPGGAESATGSTAVIAERKRQLRPTSPERLDPTTSAPMQIAFWMLGDLMRVVPGSSRTSWLRTLVPMLIGAGALRKAGRGWLGRRADIEAALLAPPAPSSRRRPRRTA